MGGAGWVWEVQGSSTGRPVCIGSGERSEAALTSQFWVLSQYYSLSQGQGQGQDYGQGPVNWIHVFDIRLCILIFTFRWFFSKFGLNLNDFQFNTVYKDEQGEVVDTRFFILNDAS